MWPPTMTPCECTEPGWCPRHQCSKPHAWHLLCRLQQADFDAWERGKGPGQVPPSSGTSPTETGLATNLMEGTVDSGTPTGPNMIARAWNFGNAVVRHVADGNRELDDDGYEARLSVCRTCPSCDLDRMVCREPDCGCFLNIKARWRSEDCPMKKWPPPGET